MLSTISDRYYLCPEEFVGSKYRFHFHWVIYSVLAPGLAGFGLPSFYII